MNSLRYGDANLADSFGRCDRRGIALDDSRGSAQYAAVIGRDVPAGHMGLPTAMKLLTTNEGWVFTGRLFWTSTGGTQWTNITPPNPTPGLLPGIGPNVLSVFFADTKAGCALLLTSMGDSWDEPHFSVVLTADGGTTWQTKPVPLPAWAPGASMLAPSGQVACADPMHAWININVVGSSNFSPAKMLITSDGGATWQPAQRSPGVVGSIVPVTSAEAWFVGGPVSEQLLVTRDGGSNWKQVQIPAPMGIYSASNPKEMAAATNPAYGLPIFKDSQNGFVSVTYPAAAPVRSATVLFSTTDGGNTWKQDRAMTGLPEMGGGQTVPSTVAGSSWLIGKRHNREPFSVLKLDSNASVSATPEMLADCGGGGCFAGSLSFVTPERGWLLSRESELDGTLLSTADGGATWSTIVPGVSAVNGVVLTPTPD